MECEKHYKPTDEQLAKRYGYCKPNDETELKLSNICAEVKCLATKLCDVTESCYEQTEMLMALDDVLVWTVRAVAREEFNKPCCEEK